MKLVQETYNSENSSYKKGLVETTVAVGAKLGSAWALNQVLARIPSGISRKDLRFLQEYKVEGVPILDAGMHHFTAKSASIKEVIWNAIKASEEMLFKIPRTFSGSTLYGSSIVGQGRYTIPTSIIQDANGIKYLEKISRGKINKQLLKSFQHIEFDKDPNKLFGHGSLFGVHAGGRTKILEYANIVPDYFGEGLFDRGKPQGFRSPIIRAMYEQHGIGLPERHGIAITGGTTFTRAVGERFNALTTVAMRNYMKLLDDPFELFRSGVEKVVGRDVLGKNTIFNRAYNFAKRNLLIDQFGVGGAQYLRGNSSQMLKRHALRGLPKIAAVVGAYKLLDTALRRTPGVKETGLGLGVSGIAAKGYQSATKTYAGLSDITGMTWLRRKQEEKAPGSTSLLGLLAFPTSFAIAGGTIGKITDLAKKVPVGETGPVPKWFSQFAGQMEKRTDKIGSAFKHIKLSSLGRPGAFGAIGATAGLLATLPFYIGTLGSEHSKKELDAIYSGKQKVSIKRGRFWEFGLTPFEGTETEFYAPHWTVRAMTDASKKGKLPEEYYNNPIRQIVERAIDPYALEKRLDEERPYTYWGPTDYGFGFVERVMQPIKEAFKPTILAHPESFEGVHPSQLMRYGRNAPTSLEGTSMGDTTAGYLPIPTRTNSPRAIASDAAQSLQDLLGLQGFVVGGALKTLAGGQSFLQPSAEYETSGRIMSAQRSYWDTNVGGAGGNCFIPGTIVKTMDGNKKIEDITIEDSVLSKDTYRKVINKFDNKIENDTLLTIKSSVPQIEITTTKNHVIPIIRRHKYSKGHAKPFEDGNYDIVEISAQDISVGDYLYYSIDHTEKEYIIDFAQFGKTFTNKYVYYQASKEWAEIYELLEDNPNLTRKELKNIGYKDSICKDVLNQFRNHGVTKNRFTRFLSIDSELSYVIGWWLAEGSSDNKKISFSMHINELEYAKKIEEYFNVLGFNSNIKFRNNCLILEIYSSIFAKYFKTFGNVYNKCIPQYIKQLPNSHIEKLIDGLILGDGWKNKDSNTINAIGGFTSVSKQLTRDLFDLLLKLGIPSCLNLDYLEKPKNDKYSQGSLRKNSLRNYLVLTKNRESWRFFDGAFLVPVSSMEEVNNQYDTLYDLEVQDLHYYTANNIIVHNSEVYRRLNPNRSYDTEYISAPVRNTQPSWLPKELQYGDPYCVALDTLIEKDLLQFVTAESIKVDDYIVTHKGNKMPVKDIAFRRIGDVESVYSLKVETLTGVNMFLSEDHPLYICTDIINDIYEWIPVKNIKKGDFVTYPLPSFNPNGLTLDLTQYINYPYTNDWIYVGGHSKKSSKIYEIYEYLLSNPVDYKRLKQLLIDKQWNRKEYETAQNAIKHNKIYPRIKRYITIDKDIAYLFGLYLAEGMQSGKYVSFALHSKEKELFDMAFAGAKKIHNCNGNFKLIENTNGAYGQIYSYIISQLLNNLFGHHSKNKLLPDLVAQFNDDELFGLLRGYIDGDGSYFIDGQNKFTITIKSVNQRLLLQVRKLLLKYNIVASIIKNNPSQSIINDKIVNSGISYNLIIRGKKAIELGKLLGYNTPEIKIISKNSYIIKDNYILLPVISNNVINNIDTVVGYEVDFDNSFCIAGIATHNTQVKMGELRLPGRGYEALNPELADVPYEEYPAVYKTSILNDVAPSSSEFYKYRALVEQQIASGQLNNAGIDLYNETMRQREEVQEGKEFDYGDGAIGSYYLGLKKFGRSLPTEALYPFSPVHKFAGPVDPYTEYKSMNVLDKPFKLWESPFSDFIKPAYNRTVDMLSLGPDFIPKETKERYELESYFSGMQYAKNQLLEEKAQEAFANQQIEEASYYRSGMRPTLYGSNPLGDVEEMRGLLPQRQQDFLQPFLQSPKSRREDILKVVSPEMQQILSANYKKEDLMNVGDIESVSQLRKDVGTIAGMDTPDFGNNVPNRDFIGYAPGVDLNAVKVKVVNHLGKNIRDYGLWREDERRAQILDGITQTRMLRSEQFGQIGPIDPTLGKRALEDYLQNVGMRGARVIATPINGITSVGFEGTQNRNQQIKEKMEDEGWLKVS